MASDLDPECQAALELAARSLPSDATKLDMATWLRALYHASRACELFPGLGRWLRPLETKHPHADPRRLRVVETLSAFLESFSARSAGLQVSALSLFQAVMQDELGLLTLEYFGATRGEVARAMAEHSRPGFWKASSERQQCLKAGLGTWLTVALPEDHGTYGVDRSIAEIVAALIVPRYRNVVLVGPSGSGKTALVKELARRIARRDSSVDARLHDHDIVEVQEPQTLGVLVDMAAKYAKMILFVEEIHKYLSEETMGTYCSVAAVQRFRRALHDIAVIGCVNDRDCRRYLDSDPFLESKIARIEVKPPTPEHLSGILAVRAPALEAQCAVKIPPELLAHIVARTGRWVGQPARAIRILERTCARVMSKLPGLEAGVAQVVSSTWHEQCSLTIADARVQRPTERLREAEG